MSEKELKNWNEWIAQVGDDHVSKSKKQGIWNRMIYTLKRKRKSGYASTGAYDDEDWSRLDTFMFWLTCPLFIINCARIAFQFQHNPASDPKVWKRSGVQPLHDSTRKGQPSEFANT